MTRPHEDRLRQLAAQLGQGRDGPVLAEAKRLLPHGTWQPWLKANGVNPRTARRVLRSHVVFTEGIAAREVTAKRTTIGESVDIVRFSGVTLPRLLWAAGARDRVSKSALYLLSTTGVPPGVRRWFVLQANAGANITHGMVRDVLDSPARQRFVIQLQRRLQLRDG